ncbi:MAG TPA: 50S ribosomal protein L25 [Syntrophomonadaceae bacterium]|nr:50S ribosomal protein L25 [Syntrophomonadaceae bacterium]HPR93269.1 50S ribosomal protein L25 [Syntrophomonadaceae bacterium]
MAIAQNIDYIKRDLKNKHFLKNFRNQNWIPGIVYGKGAPAQPIFLPARQFNKTLQVHGLRGLFSLVMEGEKPAMVLIREIQKDPLNGNIIHVDFLTLNMDEKVNNQVSIQIIGEEDIIKKGAMLQFSLKEVEVQCLPQDIPDTFICDVSNLEIGDKITVADLEISEVIELVTDNDALIVAVLAPGRGTAEETEAETEAAEGSTEA